MQAASLSSLTPRTILYTGKGGVGKTSVAAATALRCAEQGLRTLILSTDPAHSLSDSLQTQLGAEPTAVRERLSAGEIDAHHELSKRWAGVQEWLGELLVARGIDRISALELTVPPGMDELFSLLAFEQHHASGDWDVIVIDCAPTGETLRMLSFPEAARWWLERVVPVQRTLLTFMAPFARDALDVPLPTPAVLDDVQHLSEHLIAMDSILRDSAHTTIRLVMTPDRMVIGEAMRTFTHLNLYGYLTDAVIVNKVFPDNVGDYFEHWRALQAEQLTLVGDAFSPVPVLKVPYFEQEAIGAQMLTRLGRELFGAGPLAGAATSAADPAAVLYSDLTQTLESDGERATLRLRIPFTAKHEIGLKQVGLELVLRAGRHRRVIMLPQTLAGYKPLQATYADDTLEVNFDRGG